MSKVRCYYSFLIFRSGDVWLKDEYIIRQYAFWDAFHPSEKANRLIVEEIMSGSKAYMNPMNLSTILALDANT